MERSDEWNEVGLYMAGDSRQDLRAGASGPADTPWEGKCHSGDHRNIPEDLHGAVSHTKITRPSDSALAHCQRGSLLDAGLDLHPLLPH